MLGYRQKPLPEASGFKSRAARQLADDPNRSLSVVMAVRKHFEMGRCALVIGLGSSTAIEHLRQQEGAGSIPVPE